MTPLPRRPTGTDPIVKTIGQIIECLRERTPLDIGNVKFDRQPNGFGANVKTKGSKPGEVGSAEIKAVTIRGGFGGETLTCEDSEGTIYQVAAQWRFRPSTYAAQAAAMGNGATITAAGPQARNVTGNFGGQTVTEEQHITPPYDTTEPILIIRVPASVLNITGTDGQPVVWVDMNQAGRAWAAKAVIYQ